MDLYTRVLLSPDLPYNKQKANVILASVHNLMQYYLLYQIAEYWSFTLIFSISYIMLIWLVKSKFCKTPKYYLDMFLTTKTIHPISSMNVAFSQQVNSNKITFPANISHRSQYHFYCSQFCSSEYMKEWQRRNKRHKFYARQRKWKTFR